MSYLSVSWVPKIAKVLCVEFKPFCSHLCPLGVYSVIMGREDEYITRRYDINVF